MARASKKKIQNSTHWGIAWKGGEETHMQPRKIEAKATKRGIDTGKFMVCGVGEKVC